MVEPYFWDPTFDLQLLPFQDTDPVQVAEEPQGPLTPVTATNYAELVAALNTPNTEVTFTGRIENPVFADGNIIDVHLILADGALIKSPTFGAADGSCTINRFLVSSPNLGEPGTPGVTGQIHQASFFAPATNVVFDGVIMSGPGGNAGALIFNNTTGHTNDKLAVNFCLAACGGYFYIGTASNFTMVKTSARTGIDTVSQLEAWGTRNAHETLGNIVGFECDLRSSQNRINQAYHRWRIHPDNGLLNFWFGYGVLIDRVESRIAWCNRNAGGGSGRVVNYHLVDSLIIAETVNPAEPPPSIEIQDADNVQIARNIFQSPTFLSNANLTIVGALTEDLSDNDYQGAAPASDPDWLGGRNPDTIDWTPTV